MVATRRSIRAFVTSADAVLAKRKATQRVIRRLTHEFRGSLDSEEVPWD